MSNNIPRWSDITREERYFTAVLFQALLTDVCPFWKQLHQRLSITENVVVVDIGYEVCMIRDLAHAKHIERVPAREKQTFDLVLTLSNGDLVLIEAKAHQRFSLSQLDNMMAARKILLDNKALGIEQVHIAGIHSSHYEPFNVRTQFQKLALITWAELAAAYPDVNQQLQRANKIYNN